MCVHCRPSEASVNHQPFIHPNLISIRFCSICCGTNMLSHEIYCIINVHSHYLWCVRRIDRKPPKSNEPFVTWSPIENFCLTYHSDFSATSCAVALFVTCPARVNARIVSLLYRSHDQRAIHLNFLSNIVRQFATTFTNWSPEREKRNIEKNMQLFWCFCCCCCLFYVLATKRPCEKS